MDAAYQHFQQLIENALENNESEQELMNAILNETDKTSLLPLLNKYFANDNNREGKFLLGKAMQHLKLNDNDYKAEEINELAENFSQLLCGTHKSIITLLDVQKKILKSAGIYETTRLICLFETLMRLSKSPYPLNKQLMELSKQTMRFITQNLRMNQFSLCMKWIHKSLHADVHYMVLSELLNYVPLHELIESLPKLLEYICSGFCMNITAVQRGHIYKALVDRFIFFDWENYVLPEFVELLDKYQSNECFMESIKCYFVPPTAIKYREQFYLSCKRYIQNPTFCAFVLLYLVRRGFRNVSYFRKDAVIFSRHEATLAMGFEMLCKINALREIETFLYEYKWTQDKDKILSCLNQLNLNHDGVFHFGVLLMASGIRTHTEFGMGLLKIVFRRRECDEKYRQLLFNMYIKNSAVPASFIYDLVGFGNYDDLRVVVEQYKGSRNIASITKASCMLHVYLRRHQEDPSFMLELTEKLSEIDVETFSNGSTLLYVKTLKFSCQDKIIENSDSVFCVLEKCVTTLLTSNVASQLQTTDERKIYEALLSDVLLTMQMFLQKNTKENLANQLIECCYATIQLSNFKEPVTTASTILQKAATFATPETVTNLIDTCFESINLRDADDVSTIRRSAEYRLVLEKICIADASRKDDILCRLLELLKDDSSSEVAIEAGLHTLDALFSNKSLQMWTRSHIEEVVELLLEKDWLLSFRTRNAAIQVWCGITNTFKGAPLDKTFLDYDRLAHIFYLVLKGGVIEKSLFVLSVFIECPRGMHFIKPEFGDVFENFAEIFVGWILTDAGHCGRFAAEAYAAQSRPDSIATVLGDVIGCSRLHGGNETMIENFVVLVRAAVKKYFYFFGNYDGIGQLLDEFLEIIRPYKSFFNILHLDYLSDMLELVQNNPAGTFDTLNTLIAKAINLQRDCNYLMEMYAKTIFYIYENMPEPQPNQFTLQVDLSQNYSLYQFSIFLLAFSHGTDCPETLENTLINELFEKFAEITYLQDPEMLSFFASTLPYLYTCAITGEERLVVFKLASFFMVCGETDKQFCDFIATINDIEPTNLMSSVKEMLTYEMLSHHLKCDHVVLDFIAYASACISQLRNDDETSFYSIDTESDSLAVPAVKQMLLNCYRELVQK